MTTRWIGTNKKDQTEIEMEYCTLYSSDIIHYKDGELYPIFAVMKKLCRNCRYMYYNKNKKISVCNLWDSKRFGKIMNTSDPACEHWGLRRIGNAA